MTSSNDDTLLNISTRDAKCGKIQCLTSASKPIENNAVRIETTVTVGNKKFQCMGTHVYKAGQGEKEAQGDTLDPGLVMTGTKCGDDSVRNTKWILLLWQRACFRCLLPVRKPHLIVVIYKLFLSSKIPPLLGATRFSNPFSDSLLHPPPSLNRFALMENAAMHLSSELMSAMPSAMDTGLVSMCVRKGAGEMDFQGVLGKI